MNSNHYGTRGPIISIRSASYSTWLFPLFKWSNFSPLNFMKPTTQCYIGSLSHGVFEQRSSTWSGPDGFLSSGFAQIQRKLSDRKDTTQYKFDRRSRAQIVFDQISLWLRQQEIWVRDILSFLMKTQKRAEMTELHFHSLFSAIREARC